MPNATVSIWCIVGFVGFVGFVGCRAATSTTSTSSTPSSSTTDKPRDATNATPSSSDRSDRDRDRILDVDDLCEDTAEDHDGFEDLDGCPERDNDHDGFADDVDKCLNEPEIPNPRLADGCPDGSHHVLIPMLDTNLEFVVGTTTFADKDAREELDGVIAFVLDKDFVGDRRILVRGHALLRESQRSALAVRRARFVADILVKGGVPADRVTAVTATTMADRAVVELRFADP